jgi:hypothetical protein
VVGVVHHIETAYVGHTSSEKLFNLFFQLRSLVQNHHYLYFVSHLCSHFNLPGSLADGNAWADNLVSGLALGLPTQTAAPIETAQLNHPLYQQNASALCRQFHLTKEQSQQIITSCQQCVTCLPRAPKGVNPRGLWPGILWQMGVTHVSSDWQYYVHVSVDTYSGYIYALVHAGETTNYLAVFAAMGKPQQLKTNNGPAYTSTAFQQFCEAYQIHHTTKVPCNPQG